MNLSTIIILIELIFSINCFSTNILNIKLKSSDFLGALSSVGTIAVNTKPQNFEIQSIETFFKVKAIGIKIKDVGPIKTSLQLNNELILLHSDNLKNLSSIVQEKNLISIIVHDQEIISTGKYKYNFTVNFLKAFGQNATSNCLNADKISFLLAQDQNTFSLFYNNEFDNPINTLNQSLTFVDDQKILHKIEIVGSKKTTTIKFKDCERL